jgi:hypothetical protein
MRLPWTARRRRCAVSPPIPAICSGRDCPPAPVRKPWAPGSSNPISSAAGGCGHCRPSIRPIIRCRISSGPCGRTIRCWPRPACGATGCTTRRPD